MKITLLTLGHKMPEWVNSAFNNYNHRLPPYLKLNMCEINAVSRQKGLNIQQIKAQEAALIQKHIKSDSHNIALDEGGKAISTQFLAKQLSLWQMNGQDVNLIIGGADGLDRSILNTSDQTWSLSKLTFPHQIVKVLIVEQLYRAYSLLNNHPYHRE